MYTTDNIIPKAYQGSSIECWQNYAPFGFMGLHPSMIQHLYSGNGRGSRVCIAEHNRKIKPEKELVNKILIYILQGSNLPFLETTQA